jgi:hypothetical protein
MGYLLSLQGLERQEAEGRDAQFASIYSTTICFSTASTTLC